MSGSANDLLRADSVADKSMMSNFSQMKLKNEKKNQIQDEATLKYLLSIANTV